MTALVQHNPTLFYYTLRYYCLPGLYLSRQSSAFCILYITRNSLMYELIPADREKTGTSMQLSERQEILPESTQYLAASKKIARENAHSPSKNFGRFHIGLTWSFPEQVLRYYHSQRRGAVGNTFFPAVTSPGFCMSYLIEK